VQAVGTGWGKLILFGEHAAVFGHPALGVQLSERTTVTIHGPPADRWNLGEAPPADRTLLQSLLERLETLLPDLAPKGRRAIRIESTVPRGVGLGSSAALCSAAAGAALDFLAEKTEVDPDRTWELAHELERLFHGTPSGIDTGLSLHHGLTAYSPRKAALPQWEHIPTTPLWLVVGALPRAVGSAALIRGVGERVRAGEKKVIQALSTLGSIARQARGELSRTAAAARATSIGRLADGAMEILRSLGLSDPVLDALLEEGKRSGALGGKLSGAGGGGAFFLVVEDEEAGRTTAVRLEQSALRRGLARVLGPRPLCIGGSDGRSSL
jgi:mevalonate kinase